MCIYFTTGRRNNNASPYADKGKIRTKMNERQDFEKEKFRKFYEFTIHCIHFYRMSTLQTFFTISLAIQKALLSK